MATATLTKSKTNTKITPLDDRVLIKPNEAEDRTKQGIYLPEGAKEKPTLGVVISIGPGKINDEGERTSPTVKKGDTVVYGKYAGTEIELGSQKHVIVRENELLGVIE